MIISLELGVLLSVVGAVLGSVATSLIYRIPRRISWWEGRSFCVHCQQPLAPRDLIPILSFLWARARTRCCQKGLSWSYLWVELGSIGVCWWVVAMYGRSFDTLFWGVVAMAFMMLWWIDIDNSNNCYLYCNSKLERYTKISEGP